jgi:hypothetical protein
MLMPLHLKTGAAEKFPRAPSVTFATRISLPALNGVLASRVLRLNTPQ